MVLRGDVVLIRCSVGIRNVYIMIIVFYFVGFGIGSKGEKLVIKINIKDRDFGSFEGLRKVVDSFFDYGRVIRIVRNKEIIVRFRFVVDIIILLID